MKIKFKKSFAKDLSKVKNKNLFSKVKKIINEVE